MSEIKSILNIKNPEILTKGKVLRKFGWVFFPPVPFWHNSRYLIQFWAGFGAVLR